MRRGRGRAHGYAELCHRDIYPEPLAGLAVRWGRLDCAEPRWIGRRVVAVPGLGIRHPADHWIYLLDASHRDGSAELCWRPFALADLGCRRSIDLIRPVSVFRQWIKHALHAAHRNHAH